MSRHVRQRHCKNWPIEHEVDELNEDVRFERGNPFVEKRFTSIWTKTHAAIGRRLLMVRSRKKESVASDGLKMTRARSGALGTVHCLCECRHLTDDVRKYEQHSSQKKQRRARRRFQDGIFVFEPRQVMRAAVRAALLDNLRF